MTLDLEEIRHRALEFETRHREETLRVRAGLKTRPSYTALFEGYGMLGESGVLAQVERALAEAEDDEEARLRRLLAWVGRHRAERATAPMMDEYLAWEATTTLEVDGREIPLRQLPRAIAREEDRGRRRELEELRRRLLGGEGALRREFLEVGRGALEELGYGDPVEARERLSRHNYGGILAEGRRLVEETDALFRAHRSRYLDAAGIPPRGATRADERHLRFLPPVGSADGPDRPATASRAGEAFRTGAARELLSRDLLALDLPLDAGGRFTLDEEERPLKRPESFWAAPEVPARVVGVLGSAGGWGGVAELLTIAGAGLSLANVDPEQSFEQRVLGDPCVGWGHGALFRSLLCTPKWISRLDEGGEVPASEWARFGAWIELLDVRREVAALQFETELWREPEPESLLQEYPDRMEAATGFGPAPHTFVDVVDGGLGVASSLRGRLLGGVLRREMRERFGEDWFRNPGAGPFLADLYAEDGWDGRRVADRLGEAGTSSVPLLASLRERMEPSG